MAEGDFRDRLREGVVIPAHPLALRKDDTIDVRCQRALSRYYLAAGAGGLAVGVHTTQFAIHDPKVGLYKPVLELAAETVGACAQGCSSDKPVMVAGILGLTDQAVAEAQLAKGLGYDVGLLSLTALQDKSVDALIDHARAVAQVIPVMGFYLQEKVSQMVLPQEFWQRLMEIPEVVAIKIAPFNRYQTLDVLEAVAASGRADEVALYTGNDDTIIHDLLTNYTFIVGGREVTLSFAGGLLGHWACWTKRAVEYLEHIKQIRRGGGPIRQSMLTLAAQVTLANRAIFDAKHGYVGCIPGISYVLQQQGLMAEVRSLDRHECLQPGQAELIDGLRRNYSHLTDDEFVREHRDSWLTD